MNENSASAALTSEQISSLTRQTNYGTWRFQKTWKPLHIADAEGCWFTDGAGKRYLDFSSQLMCVNLGHKNPARRRGHRRTGPRALLRRARLRHRRARAPKREAPRSSSRGTRTSSSSPPAAPKPMKRPSKSRACTRARTRSSRAIAPITAQPLGSIAATGDPRRWAMEPAGKDRGRRLRA